MRVINNGLIVSCQALEDEPLFGCKVMGRMAYAAVEGGAVAIRANSVSDIEEIRKEVDVPIIGLIKKIYSDSEVYITPTKDEIDLLGASCCDVIAMDATNRKRPNGAELGTLVEYARKNYPNMGLMADISSLEEAKNAEKLGFDFISSTLYGYTAETKSHKIPDFGFIKKLVKTIKVSRFVAEGGIWTTDDLNKIIKLGVKTVVIGTAITRPREISKRFASVFV